ncbi:MAG: ABC transporter substrate-binding protein [Alphaproteobacteria bacterium]|nr:ABC transporter substrate-binding protein [Alphaproteobacteria bacterium]
MNKFFKTLLFTFMMCLIFSKAFAMLDTSERERKRFKAMNVTSFIDYPPFGYLQEPEKKSTFTSFLKNFLNDYAEEHNFQITYTIGNSYLEEIRDVRSGKIDLILGIYSKTEIYNGIEYIYPSVVNNPIYIITMPNRINGIKSTADLTSLKGGIHTKEHWNDYVQTQINRLKTEKFDNSYKLFEKLFRGEIDYIIGSRYFYMVEASKLGLLNKISFSKSAVWDMPMFLGLSKTSRDRAYIAQTLTRKLENPKNLEKINNYLIEMMNNIEKQNQGVVSPEFSRTPE